MRLRPGTSLSQGQAELDALVSSVVGAAPAGQASRLILESSRAVLFPAARPITVLLAAAGLVLLIGCANLANMLSARTRRRARELALCTALGATRLRLMRPLLIEALVVSMCASIISVVVTRLSFAALLREVPPTIYGAASVGADTRVAVIALALGLGVGILFAIVPACRAAGTDVQILIAGRGHDTSGRGRNSGRTLVAVQVALAVVLVWCAAGAARTFAAVAATPFGFVPDRVLTVDVWPELVEQQRSARSFYIRLCELLAARGDVVAVGATGELPLTYGTPRAFVRVLAGQRRVAVIAVLPGYFQTVNIPVLRGRVPEPVDVRGGSSGAVVSESAARALFGMNDPLGRSVTTDSGRTVSVIGVVPDVLRTVDGPVDPPMYVLPIDEPQRLTLVLRMRAGGAGAVADVQRAVEAFAPGAPATVKWWSDSIGDGVAFRNRRFQALVLITFGGLALGLTALGIFAIISYAVTVRRREMGVRLALGAHPRSLVTLVVWQAIAPLVAGLGLGLVVAMWLRGAAEARLFKFNAQDPVSMGIAVLVMLAVGLLAAYLPARHASRVDPMVVLRAE